MTVSSAIRTLVEYAVKEGLIDKLDKVWAVNRLLEIMCLDSIDGDEPVEGASLEEILKVLLDDACERGVCEDSVVYRDLFDTKLMGAVTPRPSEVIKAFDAFYSESQIIYVSIVSKTMLNG